MTVPSPFDNTDNYDELRKRWLNKYLKVQAVADRSIRIVVTQAAEDAYNELISLSSKKTFSGTVRSAQIRLMLEVLREVIGTLFEETEEIIKLGNKQAAVAAVTAFTETDRNYLSAALAGSGISVSDFIESQRQSAMLGVVHAVQNITREDRPLSSRVYSSRSLANRWVKQRVTSGVTRGLSANEIARDVKKIIKPTVPGGVSYAAKRLGRTEINNAFHATSIELAKDRPWVEGMRWRLSAHHSEEKRKDLCDHYSGKIFTVSEVPSKPHPQCRCFVTPEVEAYESFISHLTAGQYRSWIKDVA